MPGNSATWNPNNLDKVAPVTSSPPRINCFKRGPTTGT